MKEESSVAAEGDLFRDERGKAAESSADASGHAPIEEGSQSSAGDVLVVHPVAWTTRLIRETLENFTEARVEATSDPLRGFELALRRPFRLYLFAMETGGLAGPMLYELISVACSSGRGPVRQAPGVIFVREREDPRLPDELTRDVRVKDVLTKPLRIERLLQSVEGVFEVRDPTAGS